MTARSFCLIAAALLLRAFSASAQATNFYDSLRQVLAQQEAATAGSTLFLHPDKTVYLPQETIWFSAYLLQVLGSTEQHHTLFVSVCDAATARVVAGGKYVMDGGLAAGALSLPDSLPAGNYRLFAYTNRYPYEPRQQLYQSEFRIVVPDPDFVFQFQDGAPAADSIRLRFRVTRRRQNTGGRQLRYWLVAEGDTVAAGRGPLPDDGNLPVAALLHRVEGRPATLLLRVPDAEPETYRVPFHAGRTGVRISWLPEGGSLVNGIPARLPFRARSGDDSPVADSFDLLEDSHPIASARSNRAGNGFFSFTPQAGHAYRIRPRSRGPVLGEDTALRRPDGLSLYVSDDIVRDSLRLEIRSGSNGFEAGVLVRAGNREVFYEEYRVPGKRMPLAIGAADLAPGLLTLIVFDARHRPVAERSVWNPPPDGYIFVPRHRALLLARRPRAAIGPADGRKDACASCLR
ncbi:MAG: hypothetical protein EOO16_07290 [Chitinophagaceae bacterium]|nr:MAG: hypothetical protein EOO16_07290 [Chitinophagaceae bacterium]